MNLSVSFRDMLDGVSTWIAQELDRLIGQIKAHWGIQHADDGSHKAITADSIEVDDDVEAGGSGEFGGDVIAQDGTGNEAAIGQLTSVNGVPLLPLESGRGTGVLFGGVSDGIFIFERARSGAFSGAGSDRQISIYNLDESTTTPIIQIGINGGVANIIDGGTGSPGLSLGNVARPLTSIDTKIVAFPAAQAASADANTLDDYEEGTFTPFDASGAGLTLQAGSTGRYTKIGDRVFVDLLVLYPVTADGTDAVIGGFPFVAGFSGVIAIRFANAGITYTVSIDATTSGCTMYTNAGARITNAQLSNSFVAGSGCYRV